jgi:hypothetical protein
MSYLDRVVSGEERIRLNNNVISTGRGMVRLMLELFVAQLCSTMTSEIKKIPHVAKNKFVTKHNYTTQNIQYK